MTMDTLDADRIFGVCGCLNERQGWASLEDAFADTDAGAEVTAGAADARYLVHQDRNWNVIALTDYDPDGTNAGVVVERYSLAPYGRFVVLKGDSAGDQLGNVLMTSAVGNVFAHQGLPFDHEKRSYQNRNRDYGAPIQRFVQRDPRRYIDGLNLYNYNRSAPLTNNDADGLVCRWRWTKMNVIPFLPWLHIGIDFRWTPELRDRTWYIDYGAQPSPLFGRDGSWLWSVRRYPRTQNIANFPESRWDRFPVGSDSWFEGNEELCNVFWRRLPRYKGQCGNYNLFLKNSNSAANWVKVYASRLSGYAMPRPPNEWIQLAFAWSNWSGWISPDQAVPPGCEGYEF